MIVVYTNVFISPALKGSSWPGAVVRWLERFDGLLKTSATEREVFAVLQRPRIAEDVVRLYFVRLQRFFAGAEFVAITEAVTGRRDPKDDKFLELAVSRRADVISSGDADLLVFVAFRDTPILTPAAFAHAQAF